LSKDDFHTLLAELSGTKKLGKRKKKIPTVMTLYAHNLLIHAADFYEEMAFPNASCERGEGWLATAKTAMANSSRDISTAQPLRSVFIRHVMRAKTIAREGMRTNSIYSKIGKEFSDHKFGELEISINPENENDVAAFLRHLTKLKYEEGSHWQIHEGVIKFQTLTDTLAVWKKWGPKVY